MYIEVPSPTYAFVQIACRLSDVLSSQKELGMAIELHPLSCQTAPTEASQRVSSLSPND